MKPVRAVERALAILFLVAESDRPMGLSEISRGVGFDKATVLRLLVTLERSGLIAQNPANRQYMLGASVSRLTRGFRTDIREQARPYLDRLWRETGETVCLNCSRGVSRIVVEVIPADHEFSIVPAVGSALPIHLGASGKALMAFFTDDEVEHIVEECKSHPESNEYVVADAEELKKKLRQTRKHGFAWSIGDVFPGSAAVSAPVFGPNGSIAGSLTVRGPHVRLTRKRLLELGPLVKEVGESLSAALSDAPGPSRAMA